MNQLVSAVSKWDRDNAPRNVSLPLSLAQRIATALEKLGQWPKLAAELRDRMPK